MKYNDIATACRVLHSRIDTIGGQKVTEEFLTEYTLKAFASPALEAITYAVSFSSPVNLDGEATIHRDGSMELVPIR